MDKRRRRQLERDIARAVDRLITEYGEETGLSPHVVDIELVPEGESAGGRRRWVVSQARVSIDA
jgi:hypothetical protein